MISFGFMMLIFLVTIFIGLPIAYSIGISTVSVLLVNNISLGFISQSAFTGLDSYTFLAIPMFIFAGLLMEKGGISERLIKLSRSLVGNIYGGLGIVTIFSCTFFAAISGSSPATVAAIGSTMIPAMKKEGYDDNFAGALTAAAGSLGVLIPPSITMIIYAITAEVSIGELFLAGFIPGAFIAGSLIVTAYFISKKNGYKSNDQESFNGKKFLRSIGEAKWSLFTPIIILGGIYSGVFTPTESSIIAVVYAMIIGLFVHKELKFKDLPDIISQAALTTSTVIIILGFAIGFARYLTMARIPQILAAGILSLTNNSFAIYMMFVLLALVTGTFMATEAQILIFTPMFLPVLKNLGISPIHFGVIFIVGAQLGFLTPPVGVNLFVAQGIVNKPLIEISKKVVPFLIAMLISQIIMIIFPQIVLFIPNLFY